MTLDEQDQVSAKILSVWPDAKRIDRREDPRSGYRAFHLVPKVMGCRVEIQIRTIYQDTWAQMMEMLADHWGRGIRYGQEPLDPDRPIAPGEDATRREVVSDWIDLGDALHSLARTENAVARLRSLGVPPPAGSELEFEEVDTIHETAQRLIRYLREHVDAPEGLGSG